MSTSIGGSRRATPVERGALVVRSGRPHLRRRRRSPLPRRRPRRLGRDASPCASTGGPPWPHQRRGSTSSRRARPWRRSPSTASAPRCPGSPPARRWARCSPSTATAVATSCCPAATSSRCPRSRTRCTGSARAPPGREIPVQAAQIAQLEVRPQRFAPPEWPAAYPTAITDTPCATLTAAPGAPPEVTLGSTTAAPPEGDARAHRRRHRLRRAGAGRLRAGAQQGPGARRRPDRHRLRPPRTPTPSCSPGSGYAPDDVAPVPQAWTELLRSGPVLGSRRRPYRGLRRVMSRARSVLVAALRGRAPSLALGAAGPASARASVRGPAGRPGLRAGPHPLRRGHPGRARAARRPHGLDAGHRQGRRRRRRRHRGRRRQRPLPRGRAAARPLVRGRLAARQDPRTHGTAVAGIVAARRSATGPASWASRPQRPHPAGQGRARRAARPTTVTSASRRWRTASGMPPTRAPTSSTSR